jgi:hypothetical protein
MTRVARLSDLHPAGAERGRLDSSLSSRPVLPLGTDALRRRDAAAPLLAPPGRGATLLDRMLRADRLSEHHRGELADVDA